MRPSRLYKRLLLLLALALALAALLLGGSVALLRGTPDYYRPIESLLTPEQRAAVSQAAEQTLARMQNFAAAARAEATRAVRRLDGTGGDDAQTRPADGSGLAANPPKTGAAPPPQPPRPG